jgi:hypothetical protein
MKKYEVLAATVIFGIKEDNRERKEYILKKGDAIDLPEDNITVRCLLARKQIKETEKTVKTSKK